MDSKLAAIIRRQARPKLILSAILIIVTIALLFYYRSFVKSKTIGATTVTTVDELIEHYDSGDVYVRINADALYPLDLVVESSSTKNGVTTKKNTSFFAVAELNELLLTVELPYSLSEDESFFDGEVILTGKLKASTASFDVLGEVADILAKQFEMPRSMVLDEALVPYYLSTLGDTTAAILTVIGAILLVISLFGLILCIIRVTKPRTHRIYKQLKAFGDPELAEAALEREIADGSSSIISHQGKYEYLTDTYILSLEKGKLLLGKTEDIVWAYRRDVKNRGVTTHYVVLRMNDWKSRRTLTARIPTDAENALKSIANRLPVLCGYSAELDRIYSKNRDEFQRLLGERRAEFSSAARPGGAVDSEADEVGE